MPDRNPPAGRHARGVAKADPRNADPLVDGLIVVDPMPDSTPTDVVWDILTELGVGPRFGRKLIASGRVGHVLEAWAINRLLVVNAADLSRRSLTRLMRVPWPRSVDVVIDEGCTPIERRGNRDADIERVLGRLRVGTRRAGAEHLSGDRFMGEIVTRLGALKAQIARECQGFAGQHHRVAIIAAAAGVFDRHRTRAAAGLRLLAFDEALREMGYRLDASRIVQTEDAAARAVWPGEWIDEALDRPPKRIRPLTPPRRKQAAALDESAATQWLQDRSGRTRAHYARLLDQLTSWRAERGIKPRVHDTAHLDQWGEDLLRGGAGVSTATQAQTIGRSFYSYLSGCKPDPPGTVRDPPMRFVPPHQILIDPYDAATRARIDALIGGRIRLWVHTPQAQRLMSHKAWSDRDFAAAIDSCRLTRAQAELLADLFPRHRKNASVLRLRGALFILRFGIAAGALPREVGAGASWTVVQWLRARRHDGTWALIADRLGRFDEYADVQWHRPV